jgi:accessory colonization factor AcfC
MKKTILAVAAVLAISGSAFAGSDNYGSDGANQPVAAVDNSYTASTSNQSGPATQTPAHQGANRNLFGR